MIGLAVTVALDGSPFQPGVVANAKGRVDVTTSGKDVLERNSRATTFAMRASVSVSRAGCPYRLRSGSGGGLPPPTDMALVGSWIRYRKREGGSRGP